MAQTIHLELELEPNRQPIAGVLSSPHLANRSFDGWLELASAIEDARNSAAPATTTHLSGSNLASTETP